MNIYLVNKKQISQIPSWVNGANFQFTNVTGGVITGLEMTLDDGTVHYYENFSPVTPNGGDITFEFTADGIGILHRVVDAKLVRE